MRQIFLWQARTHIFMSCTVTVIATPPSSRLRCSRRLWESVQQVSCKCHHDQHRRVHEGL